MPVVIGKNGWEKIVELDLNEEEKAAFQKKRRCVRNMNDVLKTIIKRFYIYYNWLINKEIFQC